MQITSANSDATRVKNGADLPAAIRDRALSNKDKSAASDAAKASSTDVKLSSSAKDLYETEKAGKAGKADDKTAAALAKMDKGASAEADKADDKSKDPSAVKSFAYGALGLENPKEAAKNTDSAYGVGKWAAAAATVGSLILFALRIV